MEVALTELPPLTIVALRVGIGAACLHAAAAFGWRMPGGVSLWAAFLAMGVLNNAVPFTLIVWGQTHIAGGLASILNATTPLFTLVAAHAFTRDEKMTGASLAGVLLGIAGVEVLIGPGELAGLGAAIWAQLDILGAAASYALAAVFGRRFARLGISPLATARGQVTGSTLVLVPLALAWEQPWTLPMPGAAAWSAIAGLGALSTPLAYILYFRILSTSGATNILLVTYLVQRRNNLARTGEWVHLGEDLAPLRAK